ncbi:MAG: UvrD-helicase domain-containing protein [Saprospiraceae bacterium]
MSHYLDELNPIQRQAVTTTEGPVLVIAGPGSGKTRVLTYRIAHLIEQGVAPWNILTLTFTNKAAREMKERIERIVDERVHQIWAGTFHSIFARILRAEATKLGFPASFSIYDTDDTMSLLRNIIKEKHLDPNLYNANAIRSRISLAKSNLITPKSYRNQKEWMDQDRTARRPFLVDIYEQYMARCKRAGAMDFDDLLFQLYRLFQENPDNVIEKYQKRFRYIHVDEFQDTNFLQYAILRRLLKYDGSSENVFAVGDDAQSIYAFRGATIDNILDFEKDYPNLQTFKLEQNYRSTHHIVSAANEVISFNKRQLNKTIWTEKEDRQKIKLLRSLTDDEEGRKIADLILEQKHRYHLQNSDIAILYRTNAQSRKFEDYLRRLNIPYKVFGGMSFYQRKEVKDLVGYLRLAVNPQDEEALRRVINYPTRGISAGTVGKLGELAVEHDVSLWEAMLLPGLQVTDRAKKALAEFRKKITAWQARINEPDAYNLAFDIYTQSGLQTQLTSDTSPEGISKKENAQALLDAIGEFTDAPEDGAASAAIAGEERSLAAYLQSITLLTDADEAAEERDYVTLMSTHAAKGLEFRSVFITGLEENLFPSFMALETPNGLDEERRLFYVAITRAKEFLAISYAQNRYRFGQIKTSNPSRFLGEISPEHMDAPGGIGSARPHIEPREAGPQSRRASVSGNFSKPRSRAPMKNVPPPADFKAASPDEIAAGSQVLHLKFGKGEVKQVEGPSGNKVATIRFEADDMEERRIVLRFAKLQLL